MKRTNSRIIAMFILYSYDINKTLDIKSVTDMIDDEIEYDIDFINEIVNGVIFNNRKIDYTISLNLNDYSLDRLSYVDRALLRIGTYELLYTNIAKNIVINEIVEIAKEYSETDNSQSSKFDNAVLDRIAKLNERKA